MAQQEGNELNTIHWYEEDYFIRPIVLVAAQILHPVEESRPTEDSTSWFLSFAGRPAKAKPPLTIHFLVTGLSLCIVLLMEPICNTYGSHIGSGIVVLLSIS